LVGGIELRDRQLALATKYTTAIMRSCQAYNR